MSYLVPVLQSSSRSRFVKCWRAKTDGWAASTFHSKCDGKGPTVTIIKVGSYIFGGYTDVSWSGKYQIMVPTISLSLLYYSWLNIEWLIRWSPRQMFTNKLACLVKLFSSENAGATRLVKAWSKKRKTYIHVTCCWERGEEKLLRFLTRDALRAARVQIWVVFFFFFIVVDNVICPGSWRLPRAISGMISNNVTQ